MIKYVKRDTKLLLLNLFKEAKNMVPKNPSFSGFPNKSGPENFSVRVRFFFTKFVIQGPYLKWEWYPIHGNKSHTSTGTLNCSRSLLFLNFGDTSSNQYFSALIPLRMIHGEFFCKTGAQCQAPICKFYGRNQSLCCCCFIDNWKAYHRLKSTALRQMQWCRPIMQATWEAEVEESHVQNQCW